MPRGEGIISRALYGPSVNISIHPGEIVEIPDDVPLLTHPLSLRELEGLLGMTSEFPLVERLIDLVLDSIDIRQDPFITTQRLGLLFEVLDPSCYMPERSLSRVYPNIEVNLKDITKFSKSIDLIASFKYVKWRLASPRYWHDNCILVEGVFKK